MPKKKKKKQSRYGSFQPRLAMGLGGGMLIAVPCWDPRCECSPGGSTFAPLPDPVGT